jgi:Cu(I)/Ag(I) efflux system periplasmic protein CusF
MKTFLRLFAALATLLLLSFSACAQAHEGHLPLTDGVIKKLDLPAGKVTIAHGEIVNLKMPPMTMSFKAKDPAMLKPWKEGDKIRFRSAEVKGVLTVYSIEAAK